MQTTTDTQQETLHPVVKELLELCTRVAVDAEWHTVKNRTATYLVKQFTFSLHHRPIVTFVLWDESYPLPDPDYCMSLACSLNHPIILITCEIQTATIHTISEVYDVVFQREMELALYYSPKDVEAAVGRRDWLAALLGADSKPGTISKMRNLRGTIKSEGITFTLDDMMGVFNTSLDKAFELVGVDNPYKGYATIKGRTKDKMNLFMRSDPNEFLAYAVGDTVFLDDALVKRTRQINTIITNALGIAEPYTPQTLPRSSGSLVAHTFERWLIHKYPDLYRAVMLLTDTNDNKGWGMLKGFKEKLIGECDLVALNNALRQTAFVHGLSMGSIRNFPLLSHSNTGVFGAMVQGGRAVNEDPHTNPYECIINNVYDPDLDGCYGNALKNLDFPIGIPTVIEYGRDDNLSITLGELLSEHGSQFIPGLYSVVVSGTLSFEQDLIPSKYGLNTRKIMSTLMGDEWNEDNSFDAWGREVEPAHLGGDLVHTLSEIENGVITHDVLTTMKAVCSNQEWGEFSALKVVCAVYYPSSDEYDNHEWAYCIEQVKGGKKTAKADERPRYWTRIPLSEFIGKFIEYRATKKAEEKRLPVGSQEREDAKLLQLSVKLFVNTTYGCLAAPFFPMGNTVLANNITAKARVGVWMKSKALLLRQSITDGGIATWNEAAYLSGDKRPSMHTLSNRERLVAHRSIKVRPLTSEDVRARLNPDTRTKDDEKWFDSLVLSHVNNFWGNYGLSLAFNIEVKYDNTASKAVWFGCDYLLYDTLKGELDQATGKLYVIKSRGAKQHDHPKKLWLWHLLMPRDRQLPDARYVFTQLLGVNDFIKQPGDMELLPGDEVEQVTTHKPYNDGRLSVNYKEWKRKQDSHARAVRRYDGVERFGMAKDIELGRLKPKR